MEPIKDWRVPTWSSRERITPDRTAPTGEPPAGLPATLASVDDVATVCVAAGLERDAESSHVRWVPRGDRPEWHVREEIKGTTFQVVGATWGVTVSIDSPVAALWHAIQAAQGAAQTHRMAPGSHEWPRTPECVCGAPIDELWEAFQSGWVRGENGSVSDRQELRVDFDEWLSDRAGTAPTDETLRQVLGYLERLYDGHASQPGIRGGLRLAISHIQRTLAGEVLTANWRPVSDRAGDDEPRAGDRG